MVVDAAKTVLRVENAESEHHGSADHRCCRAIDMRSGKTSNGENNVARQEDEVRGEDNMRIRQQENQHWEGQCYMRDVEIAAMS